VIESGRGKLVKNGVTWELEAGQAFLIYPGEENYYEADQKNPWFYRWIGFHGVHVEAMMKQAGFSRENPVTTLEPACARAVCRHLQVMLEKYNLTYVNELVRMSELYAVLALLSGHDEGEEEEQEGEHEEENFPGEKELNRQYVETAVNLLIGSYQTQIRVSEVASAVGISRNYLDEIFKKELGVSPKEFLMKFRIEKANALLASTFNPVNVIAAEVGYSDPMTFSKIYRTRMGMSPSQYRALRRMERAPSDG
jgi:AraC family transcriptional regulator of arabinose operon